MRNKLVISVIGIAAALTSTYALEREASACGGCFGPPPSPTETPQVVTDHRMILTIAKDQSTLYDQIRYQGNPSSFAWVLPISGTVDVGLSADIVFATLSGQTTTAIVAPPQNCPARPTCQRSSSDSFAGASASDASAPNSPGVQVTKQEVVGPYETVQLKATDANALQQWLAQNNFSIPGDVQPVINQYVTEKYDFLALKLLPGKDVQDMRPVRVTTKGANAVLPLRMVAAGTGAVVGISLWVIGEGRYEPQNFPSFSFKADDLAWDWTTNRSNYTDLRAEKTAASNGRAWETENSTLISRTQLESGIRRNFFPGQFPPPPPPPLDGGSDGGDAGAPLSAEEQAAQLDYQPVEDAQGNIIKTAVQVRDEDLTALFYGIPSSTSRVTRIRADLAHAALNADLVMTASQDQSVLPTIRQLTKELNQPLCPVFSADGCTQIGTAPRDEAAARSGGESGESFSCSTGGTGGSPVWLGAGLGYLAIAVARARRRRAR
jgi:MYXO-CTERM domain-containing protein